MDRLKLLLVVFVLPATLLKLKVPAEATKSERLPFHYIIHPSIVPKEDPEPKLKQEPKPKQETKPKQEPKQEPEPKPKQEPEPEPKQEPNVCIGPGCMTWPEPEPKPNPDICIGPGCMKWPEPNPDICFSTRTGCVTDIPPVPAGLRPVPQTEPGRREPNRLEVLKNERREKLNNKRRFPFLCKPSYVMSPTGHTTLHFRSFSTYQPQS